MTEALKLTLAVIITFALFPAILSWVYMDDFTWAVRAISTALVLVPALLLFKNAMRQDSVPDYLSQLVPEFLEHKGLCFSADRVIRDGVYYLRVLYQSRYDLPAEVTLSFEAMKPAFRKRPPLAIAPVQFSCGRAGFGALLIPVALPKALLGTQIRVAMRAKVRYAGFRSSREMVRVKVGKRMPSRTGLVEFIALSAAKTSIANHLVLDIPAGGMASEVDGDVAHSEFWVSGEDHIEVGELSLNAATLSAKLV